MLLVTEFASGSVDAVMRAAHAAEETIFILLGSLLRVFDRTSDSCPMEDFKLDAQSALGLGQVVELPPDGFA